MPIRTTARMVQWFLLLLAATMAAGAAVQAQQVLRAGVTRYAGDAHNYIADELGFFEKHGLNVELVRSSTGLASVRRMLKGKLDLAMVSFTPVVFASLDPKFLLGRPAPDFVILANLMQTIGANAVVARNDRGIKTPRDLEGKTLAITKSTSSEYYWYTYTLFHGIDASKVRTVHTKVSDLVEIFGSGEVDAFTSWEPVVGTVRDAVGFPTTVLPAQRLYSTGRLVLARREFAQQNPHKLANYLGALLEAENFLRANKEEAARIVARRLGTSVESTRRLQRLITFNMVLDEALILNFEEQARWMVQTKLGGNRPIPNFRPLLFGGPLNAVKPGAASFLN